MDKGKQIIDSTVGNLYWKDREGRYLGCNANFSKIVGLNSPEEIIGKTDYDLWKNQDYVRIITQHDQEVINSGIDKIFEEAGQGEGGRLAFYLTMKSPFRDETGNIIGIVGTSIELTKHANVKDFIISQTVGNLYWKDREGRYLGCNETFSKMIGLPSPEDIIGKSDRDLFLDNLGEEKLKAIVDLDQCVIQFEAEQTIEETGIDKNGKIAYYLTRKVPLKDETGNVIGLIGTSIDITKQKQAEAVKAEFLKNMSHDIRTPLVGIYTLARMLYDDEPDPKRREMLADMVQSSDRLTALLNQVLEMLNLNSYSVQNTEFNISDLIEENIGLLLAAMKAKNLSFSLKNQDGMVKADKVRLNRVLTNLLSNAVKFTPEGGKIHIAVESISPFLQIDIEDTGIGIPQDKLETIFEKFTKLAPSHTQQRFSGSGIGLFIAKQFVLELGGEIMVTSQLDQGSKFSVIIPNLIGS